MKILVDGCSSNSMIVEAFLVVEVRWLPTAINWNLYLDVNENVDISTVSFQLFSVPPGSPLLNSNLSQNEALIKVFAIQMPTDVPQDQFTPYSYWLGLLVHLFGWKGWLSKHLNHDGDCKLCLLRVLAAFFTGYRIWEMRFIIWGIFYETISY